MTTIQDRLVLASSTVPVLNLIDMTTIQDLTKLANKLIYVLNLIDMTTIQDRHIHINL